MKRLLLSAFIIGGAFNLSAQCNNTLPVMENFDTNNIGVCWQIDDQDGDSINWAWYTYSPYYGGHTVVTSYSVSTALGALNPDNWIISVPIDLTSYNSSDNIQLSYKIKAGASWAAHEYYTVYAATGNQIINFTSSPVKRAEYVDEVGGAVTFATRTLDVSALAGNTAYIAFRHHNSSNQSSLDIDEVSISSGTLGIDDFENTSFKHYYNTDSDVLTLKSSNRPIDNIEIFNLLGQRTFIKKLSRTTEAIDLTFLKDGIYIAQIRFENIIKTIKFLKQ